MPKKKPYGGLSTHHVRLIRNCLKTLCDPDVPQTTMTAAPFAWINLVMDMEGLAALKAAEAGLASGALKALHAGRDVMGTQARWTMTSLSYPLASLWS